MCTAGILLEIPLQSSFALGLGPRNYQVLYYNSKQQEGRGLGARECGRIKVFNVPPAGIPVLWPGDT